MFMFVILLLQNWLIIAFYLNLLCFFYTLFFLLFDYFRTRFLFSYIEFITLILQSTLITNLIIPLLIFLIFLLIRKNIDLLTTFLARNHAFYLFLRHIEYPFQFVLWDWHLFEHPQTLLNPFIVDNLTIRYSMLYLLTDEVKIRPSVDQNILNLLFLHIIAILHDSSTL